MNCECSHDGFCPRYQRTMSGRLREICAGINCDLGTSAAFREQWAREAGTAAHLNPRIKPTPLLLITKQAPGDAVVMTAAIYSLHRAHPGKYLTAVMSPYPEVFAHNPDVAAHFRPGEESLLEEDARQAGCAPWLQLRMHYPAIHQSNERGIHFMQAYCEFLGKALGIDIPLLTNRPQLFFKEPYVPSWMRDETGDNFWIICSGGKRDITNKLWGHNQYQEVINKLGGKIRFIQVGDSEDNHPPLRNAEDRVGKTTLRGLIELCWRSQGVLCGVSLPMHIAAALSKPCVVIAGGREPVQWNSYPKQHYLHTVGMLPCTDPQGRDGACWRSRLFPLGDNEALDQHTCLRPTNGSPECMTLISPAHVVDLILKIDAGQRRLDVEQPLSP